MPPDTPSVKRILLGAITGAHGIRGDVVIRTFTDNPADIASYGSLSDADGNRSFALSSVRVTSKGAVAKIIGIDDRNAAEALRGMTLHVDRLELPSLPSTEFYRNDLIGLAVFSEDGAMIGEVVAVDNFGAGDLLELALIGRRTTEYVPFLEAFVPSVDLEAGRVTVLKSALPENASGDEPRERDALADDAD